MHLVAGIVRMYSYTSVAQHGLRASSCNGDFFILEHFSACTNKVE